MRWRGSGSLPLEHTPAEITVSGAHSPICASLFSAALLNIQGTKSCIGAGFRGIGLFLRLLRARDRNRERQEERVSGRLERRESSVVQRASCKEATEADKGCEEKAQAKGSLVTPWDREARLLALIGRE